MTEDDARRILGPIEDKLVQCHVDAHATWTSKVAKFFPVATRRGRRNIYYELLIERVRKAFVDTPGAVIREMSDNRIVMNYKNVAVRFKWLDGKYRASTFATPLAKLVETRRQIIGFPGKRITIGHRFDEFETKLEGVYAVHYVQRRVPAWHYALAQPAAQLRLIPPVAPKQLPPQLVSRVKPKQPKHVAKVVNFPNRKGKH